MLSLMPFELILEQVAPFTVHRTHPSIATPVPSFKSIGWSGWSKACPTFYWRLPDVLTVDIFKPESLAVDKMQSILRIFVTQASPCYAVIYNTAYLILCDPSTS